MKNKQDNLQDVVNRLRELLEKATPGPWNPSDNYVTKENLDGERGIIVAECFAGNPLIGDNENDTYFIAEMRNSLPTLLNALESSERREQERSDELAEAKEILGFAAAQFIPTPDAGPLSKMAREFLAKTGRENE